MRPCRSTQCGRGDTFRTCQGRPNPTETPRSVCWSSSRQVSWLAAQMLSVPFPAQGQWYGRRTCRLQLRGQLRFWPLMGNPHRIPFSSALIGGTVTPFSRHDHRRAQVCQSNCGRPRRATIPDRFDLHTLLSHCSNDADTGRISRYVVSPSNIRLNICVILLVSLRIVTVYLS